MTYFPEIQLQDNQNDKRVETSPQGELICVQRTRLVGTQFEGSTLDANFWTATAGGTGGGTQGSATLTTGNLDLASGTDTDGSIILQSVRVGRYISAHANNYRSQIRHDAITTADCIREWGVYNGTDGAYFKLTGGTTPVLSVCTIKTGGSEVAVNSGSFNGKNGASYTLDTNCHTYEIYYNNKVVRFFIDDILIHTVTASAATWTTTLSLPSRAKIVKSAGAASLHSYVRSASIVRTGYEKTTPTWTHISGAVTLGILKRGPGMIHRIVINSQTGTLTLYDSIGVASGTIAILDLTKAGLSTLEYAVHCQNGVTYTTSGSPDITIVYE